MCQTITVATWLPALAGGSAANGTPAASPVSTLALSGLTRSG
jgi:hypothetical protein